MHIHHDASVFVTDGRKAMLLRNEGDTEFPDLRLEQKWEQHLTADRDLKSDAPGRTFSSYDGGTRRSAYEQSNLHAVAETRFVSDLAEFLQERCLQQAIHELVIVAPPRMLGELRKHLGRPLQNVLVAEIPKDLVKHPSPISNGFSPGIPSTASSPSRANPGIRRIAYRSAGVGKVTAFSRKGRR